MNYSKNSSITLSVSTNFFIDPKEGKRVYQKGFKPISIHFDEVVQVMNSKAVAAANFKSGKRIPPQIVKTTFSKI